MVKSIFLEFYAHATTYGKEFLLGLTGSRHFDAKPRSMLSVLDDSVALLLLLLPLLPLTLSRLSNRQSIVYEDRDIGLDLSTTSRGR